jgi:hypothetical protein
MFSAPSLLTKKLPIIWAILWEKENIEQKTTKKFKTVKHWSLRSGADIASFPTSLIFHFTIPKICPKLWIGHGMGRVPMTTASCGHSGLKKNTKGTLIWRICHIAYWLLIGIGDPPVTFHQGAVARSPAELVVHSTCQTAWPLLSWKGG